LGFNQASAAPISVNFVGTISFIQNPSGVPSQLTSLVHMGESFTGTLKYDPTMPALDMTPYCGTPTCSFYQLYNAGVAGQNAVSATIGLDSFFANSGSNGQISNSGPTKDFNLNFGLSGPAVGALTPAYTTFNSSSDIPSSPVFAWPTSGFFNSDFSNQTLSFTYYLPGCDANGACYFSFGGVITDADAVPEPLSLSVFCMGLLGLAAARAKHRSVPKWNA